MILWDWLIRKQRRKNRDDLLMEAQGWPIATAKLLAGELVEKDELAGGTTAQDKQVEFPYYFTLEAGYFGSHVRTIACSESEARRLMKQVPEGTMLAIRYDPADPDRACVLAADNVEALVVGVWEG